MKTVRIGIIGGGLMGREMASTFARWCALLDTPVKPELVAVADLSDAALSWFNCIPTAKLLTNDYQELIASPDIDVIYVAVPHSLHEQIYLDVLAGGKDLFAEKPFGIDLESAKRIQSAVESSNQFVRCSSEFPFFPGAKRAFEYVLSGACGRILESVSGFHHASDLDPNKAANWKRQSVTCGEIGVLGDLGMHACHLPLRLGWKPSRLYAQLSRGFSQRPDGKGGTANCDTWDNASLHCWVEQGDHQPEPLSQSEPFSPFPLRLEMKRLAPGETNTWFFEALGTKGGVRYSTKSPKRLETFRRDESTGEQIWQQTDLGFATPFKTITGGIFEVGFADIIQQMWASYLTEREGKLDGRFGCATVGEAVDSQQIFAAALKSQSNQSVEAVN
jgi:predicted dehydrogenase